MYGSDLTQIHHAGFGGFARGAGPQVLELLAAAGWKGQARRRARAGSSVARATSGARVLDLGCGSGIWLAMLDRAGYRTAGIDSSPAMIRLARKHAPNARLEAGSIYATPLPACDAVTAMGEVLSYCPARAAHPSLPRFFKKVARTLPLGGVFVFDLFTAGGPTMNYRKWAADTSWAIMIEVSEDPRRQRLHRVMTTFRKARGGYRRDHERHVLHLYARRDVERWLREVGFSVRTSRRYGDFTVPPRRLVFTAKKRTGAVARPAALR